MGDNSEESKGTSISMENLNLDTIRLSRDLLQRFGCFSSKKNKTEVAKRDEKEEEGDVELSLGLSLGGRFGVDKSCNKLVRSSSVAACLSIVRNDDTVVQPLTGHHPLTRTSSLPVESEVEWRKRKELQTLRRMEAKRRRSEKQRICRGDKQEESRGVEVNWREKLELLVSKRVASSVSLPFGLPTASGKASHERGIDLAIPKGKASYVRGSAGGLRPPLSQGSIESHQGRSLSMSELEFDALQGPSSGSDLSPVSIQEGRNQNADSSGGTKTNEHSSRTVRSDVPRDQGTEDMPCVFTKGDGPNGSRVDGILYKYGKGEEVRIMCVCHGNLLSPAEFVKHAGGIDVAHPLKHIVVNPNPPSVR